MGGNTAPRIKLLPHIHDALSSLRNAPFAYPSPTLPPWLGQVPSPPGSLFWSPQTTGISLSSETSRSAVSLSPVT